MVFIFLKYFLAGFSSPLFFLIICSLLKKGNLFQKGFGCKKFFLRMKKLRKKKKSKAKKNLFLKVKDGKLSVARSHF